MEKYYRYILDVDGNAWSARFKRLLTTGSLIFKSTIMRESPTLPRNCVLFRIQELTNS